MKLLYLILVLIQTKIERVESCRQHSDCGTGYCNGGTAFATGSCIEKRQPGQVCIKTQANLLLCDDDSCRYSFSACGNCGPVPNEYACSHDNECQSRLCSGSRTANCNGVCRERIPVNGNWGHWSSYGTCSTTCGGGLQIRSRSCTSPAPSNGGVNCAGENHGTRTCNARGCPVNGNWGQWSNYGSCSTTCGTSTKQRSRSCTNPQPTNGGANCAGSNQQTQTCNVVRCPGTLDYNFYTRAMTWSAAERECVSWGGHLATVDSRIQNDYFVSGMRVRNMGSVWIGLNDNTRERRFTWVGATTNGGYTNWFSGEPNGGTRDNCVEIIPGRKYNRNDWGGKWNDASCTSLSAFICERPKGTTGTTLLGNWGSWGSYGPCSRACGHGTRIRSRSCNGAGSCSGSSTQQISCIIRSCNSGETTHNEGQRGGMSKTATISVSVTGPVVFIIMCICCFYCCCKD